METAANCRECRERCKTGTPDLIILDIGLPDGDGFSLMSEIRAASFVPVLFLSARDEDSDRLLGLGLGADDYMTKPFLPGELVLRMTAILKRTYFPPSAPGAEKAGGQAGAGRPDRGFRGGMCSRGRGRRPDLEADRKGDDPFEKIERELGVYRDLRLHQPGVVGGLI